MTEFTNYFITRGGICYNIKTEKILKKIVRKDGYERVLLFKDGKRVVKRIDELVADIYLRKPESNQILIHKDLDKLNNDYNNLEYVNNVPSLYFHQPSGNYIVKLKIKNKLLIRRFKDEDKATNYEEFLNKAVIKKQEWARTQIA
jgi:hypothetical protein